MSKSSVKRYDWESDAQFEGRRQRVEAWWSTYLPDVQPKPEYAVVKPAELEVDTATDMTVPDQTTTPKIVDPRPAKYKRMVLNLSKEFAANGLPKWAAHLRRQVEDIEAGK